MAGQETKETYLAWKSYLQTPLETKKRNMHYTIRRLEKINVVNILSEDKIEYCCDIYLGQTLLTWYHLNHRYPLPFCIFWGKMGGEKLGGENIKWIAHFLSFGCTQQIRRKEKQGLGSFFLVERYLVFFSTKILGQTGIFVRNGPKTQTSKWGSYQSFLKLVNIPQHFRHTPQSMWKF